MREIKQGKNIIVTTLLDARNLEKKNYRALRSTLANKS